MRVASLIFALAFVAGCSCGEPTTAVTCQSSSQCATGEECLDGMCQPMEGRDGSTSDGDGGSMCASAVLCGSPAACCAVGDECVAGSCLDACASGVRCGADLTTCCGASQVCVSDACVDPGAECTDSFECDPGSFCEPTLGRCLPQFDPVMCETTPVFGDFEVTLEWSAETATEVPECMHPISTPVVVDLDGDRLPEVVASMACDASWTDGVLRAYRGADGTPLWTASDPALRVNGRSSIAAGDLDGDGTPEIVAMQQDTARALAFRADGTLAWSSTNTDGTPFSIGGGFVNGAPTIADLDGDGSPEIILGATVLDANGVLLWTRDGGGREGTNGTYAGGISAVANLDAEGFPEVVTGRRAYRHDGSPFWENLDVPDGYPAIAQLDEDPQPEVVIVGSVSGAGRVFYLDGLSGALEWGPVLLPGGGIGGPPTIADFDGDGAPELGVAGAASYTVYDPTVDGGIVWSAATQDESSNTTGSSVFDFEGDGAAEVVYADECYVRVYRGTDGEELLRVPSTSSTIHEYPLVADVDGDGNSEIVIVANDRNAALRTQCPAADPSWDGRRKGVFVYGDARDQWVRTRRVWNQHAYHVTNVEPDGTIPMTEASNWTTPGLNNYRQNAQGEGVFNAPDLKVLALEVSLADCPESARLRARVSNEGSLGVPAGVRVAFYRGTEATAAALLGVVTTTVPLLPGASTVVELDAPLTDEAPYAFVAVVDDDGAGAGAVTECDEDDNAGSIADVDCGRIF